MCVHRCVCMRALCALGYVRVRAHVQTWIRGTYSKDAASGERGWNGVGVVPGPEMYHVHVRGPEMYHAGSPPGQGSGLLLVFISAPNMANVNIC